MTEATFEKYHSKLIKKLLPLLPYITLSSSQLCMSVAADLLKAIEKCSFNKNEKRLINWVISGRSQIEYSKHYGMPTTTLNRKFDKICKKIEQNLEQQEVQNVGKKNDSQNGS